MNWYVIWYDCLYALTVFVDVIFKTGVLYLLYKYWKMKQHKI